MALNLLSVRRGGHRRKPSLTSHDGRCPTA